MQKRKPYLVEFTGTPEAGKTTTINLLSTTLEKMNYKVKILNEAAESLPKYFPKGSWNAHIWMRLKTIQKILESYYNLEYDIVLIDRGYLDSYYYGMKLFENGSCDRITLDSYNQWLDYFNFLMPNCLIAFKVLPEVAIARRGGEGSIVTTKFLNNYNLLLDKFLSNISCKKMLIDTTQLSIDKCVTLCKEFILKNYAK